MKDHQLKAWLQLVESGSIRGASRDLRISPAAITKAVRELEADVDAQLVVRSSRGIVFTESGRQLTVRARLAQAQLDLARQDIRMLQGDGRAHVSVSVTPMVFLGVLPDVVTAFRKALPQARLTLFDGLVPQALPMLREGSVDFAIAGAIATDLEMDIDFEPLDTMEMAVLCRRGHPLREATTWSEVVDAEWLMHIAPGSQHARWLDQLKGQGLRPPERVIEVHSFGTSSALLTRSDALLVAPAELLRSAPYRDMIERVPLALALPPLALGLLTPRGLPLSMAAERMAELFRKFVALEKRQRVRRATEAQDAPPPCKYDRLP
ncbi:MAG: LysR substrate-binding domain-containing protein [Hydrogenophaga sp.]|nr:LysR substrate-binding domain-containing protein [Hydrogenophaga sp.]